jgi:beta-lactamase regulating signal transducer with metallopeptidase domain
MNPEVCLHFVAVILNYLLRITAAYCVCWILNRLLAKPSQRFVMWMAFLLGSAAYWLDLVFGEVRSFTAAGNVDSAGITAPPVHSLLVPLAWSSFVPIVVRGLAAVYVVAALLLVAVQVFRYLHLHALLRRTVEPSDALNTLFGEICRDLGLSRARLVILPGLKSPATAGWWNPRILLPEVCEQIGPTAQVADVLSHELIHVSRRDYFLGGLGDLVCCLLFFHPAIWKARKDLVLQGELACDRAVLEARPGNRADYADSLTYFVRLRMLRDGYTLGIDFAASTSLGLRIRTILTAPQPSSWWKRTCQFMAGLGLVAALSILSPALAIPLTFGEPISEPPFSVRPLVPTSTERTQGVRHVPRRGTTQAAPDTLTALRARPYVSETPAYTMTSGTGQPQGSERAEEQSPAWQERPTSVQHPSVASVLRSTLGEIAARTAHGGHGRDRDDH